MYDPPETRCRSCKGTGDWSSGHCGDCGGDGKEIDYGHHYEEMQEKLEELKEKYPEEFI